MITTCILDNNKFFTEFLKCQLTDYGNYEVLYSSPFIRHIDDEIEDILRTVDLLILCVNNDSECRLTVERILNHSDASYKLILHDITDGYVLLDFLSLGINGLISKMSPKKDIMPFIEDSIANKHFICPTSSGHLIGYLGERNKSNVFNQLTPKQKQIAEGLLRGLSYKEIAVLNGISINTVNDYLKRIYKALNISSRSELQARFNKNLNSMYA
jgi:DNA-binding NarL/FixJ family response regulator